MQDFSWRTEPVQRGGIAERDFHIRRDGKIIPGVTWYPAGESQRQPLVLLGHGGLSHKRSAPIANLAGILAGTHGCWVAAIDGPVHGERGSGTDTDLPSAYTEMWRDPHTVRNMVDDWTATLDALITLDGVDASRVGYWGKSMGAMFGLPYVAGDPRIRVAVLGKAGMTGPSVKRSGIDAHFTQFAPRLTVPVLFTMQWDDERFERAGQLDLYDRLGAKDKRLHAYPGGHFDNAAEAPGVEAAFLMRYLFQAG